MANPKSAGIGTGAAQVYDYTRIDNAMRDAMDVVNRKKELHQRREDELSDEKRKAMRTTGQLLCIHVHMHRYQHDKHSMHCRLFPIPTY